MPSTRHPLARGACRLALAAVAALSAACAGYSLSPDSFAQVTLHEGSTRIAVTFSDADRRAIHDYYAALAVPARGGHGHNPHGGPQALPPGIRKQIARGKGLPPGLNREPLPVALERRLAPLPDGYVRVLLGTDVVLFDTRGRVVVDLLRDLG
jgi:hypothetical protein